MFLQPGIGIASFPGVEEGEEKECLVHMRNYSKGHVVELGVCTNMTIRRVGIWEILMHGEQSRVAERLWLPDICTLKMICYS